MSLSISLRALVRRLTASNYSDGNNVPNVNSRGDLCVAPSLPPKAEIVRLGRSWYTAIPTASAFQPVAAMPTTLSNLTVRNSYSDGATCLVIDAIGIMSLTSLAAASGMTLLAQVNEAAALTDNTAVLISGMMGGTYNGSITRALATTTATANKWMALSGINAGGGTATIGSGIVAEIAGGFIIKPGFTLHTNVVASTAAGTCIQWVSWHEVTLPIA